jgi:hypothetical protein
MLRGRLLKIVLVLVGLFFSAAIYPAIGGVLDPALRLMVARASLQSVVMLGMGIFLLGWLLLNPDVEFTYYRSTKPFPNQRFARVVFYIVGIVLVLGGLWDLRIDWHAGH